MTTPGFTVIAHRGASSYAPENTLAAFDLAIQMGVSHIELDVHFTRDGHVVVIHDETVDRTTNGSGPVTSHALAALQGLDAGSWFGGKFAGQRIPTFEEILERYQGRAEDEDRVACSFCAEPIKPEAVLCPHCGSIVATPPGRLARREGPIKSDAKPSSIVSSSGLRKSAPSVRRRGMPPRRSSSGWTAWTRPVATATS